METRNASQQSAGSQNTGPGAISGKISSGTKTKVSVLSSKKK